MASDEVPPWIKDKILRGEAILFLGAGAAHGSVGAKGEEALSGDQLRDKLSDRFLGGSLKSKSLAHVAEFAKSESSLFEVQRFVSDLFEPLFPASFHKLIPQFRWHAILTTNYDHVVERAYQSSKAPAQILGRIVRDGDNFGEVISSIKKVPFLKLHGCLSVINDAELPLILSTEEYAKFRKNRNRLFRQFEDWSREYPIIFCGYDLSDPNVQQILYDIGDSSINRAPFLMVRPNLSGLDHRYWQSRRVIPISQTFEEFICGLDVELPSEKRVLSSLIDSGASSLQRWIVRGSLSETLRIYLARELEHVRADITTEGVLPNAFYRGEDGGWDALRRNLDIPRRISDDILIEAILDAPSSPIPKVHVIKGHAGSGKSITIRRAAWDAATKLDAMVLFLKKGGLIRTELFRELCSATDDRVFLFVEDAMQHLEELNQLLAECKKSHLRVSILMAVRTNEWNVAGDQFHSSIDSEYELRDLSNKEIDQLLSKLEEHECMSWLGSLPREAQIEHFVLSANRQLLVALHEATSGKPFEEIVLDEYKKLIPNEAQVFYKDICTLHRFDVGVRAGLVSRVSGVTFSYFDKYLLKPLEHVVHVYTDAASRDYAYRTRHPLVADWVFRQIFENQDERSNQIVRIIGAMNTEYESDSKAFNQLIRGRELAELFSDRVLADRIFEAAGKSGASPGHVEHQRAVFELNHPGGNTDRALKALDLALESAPFQNQAILHTKAMALRKKASESEHALARQKYRSEAKIILQKQVGIGSRPHSFHALGQLLLDEFLEELQTTEEAPEISKLKERVISDKLAEIEKNIKQGFQRFPDDTYLLSLEARLAEVLHDNRRAFNALKSAQQNTPQNEHIAVRFSRMLQDSGDVENAKSVLINCIESNPISKLVRLELAKILIQENEQEHRDQVRSLLRSSFTDGDNNLDSQFWFARHEYLYGDQEKSKQLFDSLTASKVPPTIRNRRRGSLVDKAGKLRRFDGVVTSVRDTYCFVSVPSLHSDAFVHHTECNDTDWTVIHAGQHVNIALTFSFKGAQGIELVIRSNT